MTTFASRAQLANEVKQRADRYARVTLGAPDMFACQDARISLHDAIRALAVSTDEVIVQPGINYVGAPPPAAADEWVTVQIPRADLDRLLTRTGLFGTLAQVTHHLGLPEDASAEEMIAKMDACRRFDAPSGLSMAQEPKYTVTGSAIVNRASGEAIPSDEPVFIFRARDKYAASVIGDYAAQFCTDPQHHQAVEARFIQFSDWAEAHPERMKEPDTATPPAAATSTPCASREGETAIDPAALDRAMFERAHKAAGYGEVKWNSAGDRPLFQNDAARYAGWQLARDDLAAAQAPAVPATKRPWWMTAEPTVADYPEDYECESGCYENRCAGCKVTFHGSKHRGICKVCARTPPAGNTED